jgi:hypothetical protein
MRSPHFLPGRLSRSFDVVHRRAQDGGRARLHEWVASGRVNGWVASGRVNGFVMAYLGLRDERLPFPIADLVPRETMASYGTNFSPMSSSELE